MKDFDCKEFRDMLCDYLDSELDQEHCRLFEKHIENCEACRISVDKMKNIISLCENTEKPEMPDEIKIKLEEFIRRELILNKEK